jgi:hypothetical protein
MAKYETRFIERKVKGRRVLIEVRVERKRSAAIVDRLIRKHKLNVLATVK